MRSLRSVTATIKSVRSIDETIAFQCGAALTLSDFGFMVGLAHWKASSAPVIANTNQETLMNKDQTKGHIEEAKGTIKEVAGKILGDDDMKLEGNVQKNVGKVQAGIGDFKKRIKKDR